MKILLAEPRGFCSGVERAIKLAESELMAHPGETLYLLHELVHNETVTRHFAESGAKIVSSLDEIPAGGRLLISAHGAAGSLYKDAEAHGLVVVDATCPLVRAVQRKASDLTKQGLIVLLFGNPRHKEVEGIIGQCVPGKCMVLENRAAVEAFEPQLGVRYACLSQTTWNADEVAELFAVLQKKSPLIESAGSVCFATRERQNAVRKLAERCDAMLIVGSAGSSNTLRLLEIAKQVCGRAYLVPDETDLVPEMTAGAETVGIASGASAPESVVRRIVAKLNSAQ